MVKMSEAFVSHDEFACGNCRLTYDCGWVLVPGAYKNGQSGIAACSCDMMVPPADAGHLVRSSAPEQLWLFGALMEFAASGLRVWL